VLESVGGNQDRAIDALLGMSDPEYKGEPPTTVQPEQLALVRSICPRILILLIPYCATVTNRARRTICSPLNAGGATAAAATMGQH
jgi:hypothetical protein